MLIPLALFGGLTGCAPEPQVKTQSAPRLDLVRTLGAIVFPAGDRSTTIYLFKMIGPELDIDRLKPAFEKFILNDLTFDAREKISWPAELPTGWTERKVEKQAVPNLVVDGKVEIAVSRRTMRKPKRERQDVPNPHAKRGQRPEPSFVIFNVDQQVNNWRRELGLLAMDAEEAGYYYDPYRLTRDRNALAFIVNMVGPGQKNVDNTEFVFELPEGWVETMPRTLSLLTFRIQEKDKDPKEPDLKAYLTIGTVDVKEGVDSAILANFNRWRGQVSLKNLDDGKSLTDITIAGIQGKFADMQRPPSHEQEKKKLPPDHPETPMMMQKEERIFGALIVRHGQMWYFKMSGPTDLLERHRSKFNEFLSNFAFTE